MPFPAKAAAGDQKSNPQLIPLTPLAAMAGPDRQRPEKRSTPPAPVSGTHGAGFSKRPKHMTGLVASPTTLSGLAQERNAEPAPTSLPNLSEERGRTEENQPDRVENLEVQRGRAGATDGPTRPILPTAIRPPTPMRLVWTSAADKCKGSRHNPIGTKKKTLQEGRKATARAPVGTFFKSASRPPPQSPQASRPSPKPPDIRTAVLHDSQAGESLYIESIYADQHTTVHADGPTFEFTVSDCAYPLCASSVARLHQDANCPSGYASLTGTIWVCGETITSTLHIIARAEGWGLQTMPPQPGQTVWLGASSYWSKNLLTPGSGRALTDPTLDAGVTGAFFGKKPKQIQHASHGARTALFERALQVKTVYVPFNIHGSHWVYFKVDLDSNTVTLHDPSPPPIQLQAMNTKKFLHRLAEWLSQVKHERKINRLRASGSLEAGPALECHLTRFRTITSNSQEDGFQCAIFCIGNIAADAANRRGRVRQRNCEEIRRYVGLLLWLNSQRFVALSLTQQTALFGLAPSGAVLRGNDLARTCVRPGPLSRRFTEEIIKRMIGEIGGTPPVDVAPILPDWTPTLRHETSGRGEDPTPINEVIVYISEGSPGPQNAQQGAGGQGVHFLNSPADAEATGRPYAGGSIGSGPRPGVQLNLGGERPSRIGPGLHNPSNSCYCNVVLQCLTYTAPFSKFCLNRRHSARVGDGSTSTRYDALLSVEAHVIEALHTRKSSIAPTSILANLNRIGKQFSANRQQDAHEFLRSLTANMRLADLNLDRPRPSTSKGLMHTIFGGLLYSQIQCAACSYRTSSTDAFLDLSMEVNQTLSVEEALRLFTMPEVLDEDNKFRCPGCGRETCATKILSINIAPQVLQLHLKRFGVSGEGANTKISHHVTFPETPSVATLVNHDNRPTVGSKDYGLYAVITLEGTTVRSGHYLAYVKAPNGNWFRMDDSNVRAISIYEVLKVQAYMLFYTQAPSGVVDGTHTHVAAAAMGRCVDEATGSQGSEAQRPRGTTAPIHAQSEDEAITDTFQNPRTTGISGDTSGRRRAPTRGGTAERNAMLRKKTGSPGKTAGRKDRQDDSPGGLDSHGRRTNIRGPSGLGQRERPQDAEAQELGGPP